MKSRYSFLDDYSEGAHPQLLQALLATNASQELGYGRDSLCEAARRHIRKHLGSVDAGVFFVPSGTSANAVSIAACLRPHEAVIAAPSGHIVARECGAIEQCGHKIISTPGEDGKLTPRAIQQALDENWHFPHVAKPRLVYISNSTEVGTVYTKAELRALKTVCENNGLILFMDGARLGAALASKKCDLVLRDILELTDMFWIGGTKNGALIGEAIVVKDASLSKEFEFHVKQHGCLLAKGRVVGAQFCELFREDLFLDIARKANHAALKLGQAITEAGFTLLAPVESNQVFAKLPMALVEALQAEFVFYVWERHGDVGTVRLITTWATDLEELARLMFMIGAWGEDTPVTTPL